MGDRRALRDQTRDDRYAFGVTSKREEQRQEGRWKIEEPRDEQMVSKMGNRDLTEKFSHEEWTWREEVGYS